MQPYLFCPRFPRLLLSSRGLFAARQARPGGVQMIESLEPRRLMAVTVNQMYPGFYEINGDSAANAISATVSQNDDTFTLDGTTYSDVSYIYVHGNGGDDTIHLMSLDGSGIIGASITGDDGNDDLSLNFDGGIWGGNGNDTIHLSDSFRGEAAGEAGNDQIFISGACVDAEIEGGDGADLIDCSNNYYHVTIHGGAGDDTIYGSAFDDVLYGDEGKDLVYAGNGDDSIYGGSDGQPDTVDGGGGSDTYYSAQSQDSISNVETVFYG